MSAQVPSAAAKAEQGLTGAKAELAEVEVEVEQVEEVVDETEDAAEQGVEQPARVVASQGGEGVAQVQVDLESELRPGSSVVSADGRKQQYGKSRTHANRDFEGARGEGRPRDAAEMVDGSDMVGRCRREEGGRADEEDEGRGEAHVVVVGELVRGREGLGAVSGTGTRGTRARRPIRERAGEKRTRGLEEGRRDAAGWGARCEAEQRALLRGSPTSSSRAASARQSAPSDTGRRARLRGFSARGTRGRVVRPGREIRRVHVGDPHQGGRRKRRGAGQPTEQ